ncbi:MAG TPA: subclass B3 metallo-beta-lactamase [Gemmatimonadaceae bacterium]|nr:subclass B3 metallo-beta-lactamase [Gemmatimonadaceae bacterium]
MAVRVGQQAYRAASREAEDLGRTFAGGSSNGHWWTASLSSRTQRTPVDTLFVLGRAFLLPARDSALVVMIDGVEGDSLPPRYLGVAWVSAELESAYWPKNWVSGDTTFFVHRDGQGEILRKALEAAPSVRQFLASARAAECPNCAEWNAPTPPLRIFGNVYYVGTRGLSAVLLTSNAGHVLIDGGLPESAPSILANIRTLGFKVEDIKLILNSHAHFDHAGGIAALQRASGARVAASPPSARVLRSGSSGLDDPQYGVALAFPRVADVTVFADGDTLSAGPLAVSAHFTPGHTPGGTSWSWRACERDRCLNFVYADSQTPVSADGFFFTRSQTYPSALKDFEHGFATLEMLPCDVLLTPHPDASGFWERLAARDRGVELALVDSTACKRFVAGARKRLAQRVSAEGVKP